MSRIVASLALTAALAACSSTPAGSPSSTAAAAGEGGTDQRAAARAQLEELASAAVAFETQNGRCIQSVDEIAQPAPTDPWGAPVAFMPAGPENPQSALVSSGPDKELLTSDDVTVPVTCAGGR